MFIVLSLPRSRSAWLRYYLGYPGLRPVGHDLAARCGSLAEFRAGLEELAGTCETGAVLGWRVLREEFPDARLAVVRRPVEQVRESLARFGVDMGQDLDEKAALLDEVARESGVLVTSFAGLRSPETCRGLFEHCTQLPFDYDWWRYWHGVNVQVDMPRRMEMLVANVAKTQALRREVAARLKGLPSCPR